MTESVANELEQQPNQSIDPIDPSSAHKKTSKGSASKGSTSKSPRRRSRELAVQGLYQWRIGGNDEAAIEAHLADQEGFNKADYGFFTALLRGVLAERGALVEHLQAHLDRPFDELSPIEASVLLCSAYELCHYLNTPYRVIINEAIELTKSFGGTDGHKYVNGVLDKLALKLRAVEVEARRMKR